MPNENCLTGMRCPECKSEEPFRITAKTIVTVYDDGTDKIEDVEWDNSSFCSCAKCDHMAKVRNFQLEWQAKPELSEEQKKLIGYCSLHCHTERALFSGRDVARMFELAGEPLEHPPDASQFFSMHDEMMELVTKAQKRHR